MDFQQPNQQQSNQQQINQQQPDQNIQPNPVVDQPSKNIRKIVVLTIIGVLILGSASYGAYYWWPKNNKPVACTREVKQCPDGFYVSRTGPNCEFAACPADETAGWKTYLSEKYGFEVKYPADWIFSEGYSQQTTEGSILTGSHNSFHISSKGNDYVSINPEGAIHAEDENPKISFINIGDAKAQQMEWDKWPKYKVIRVLDEKPNWLKDFNVIMVVSDKYDKIIQQLLSTFKFTK